MKKAIFLLLLTFAARSGFAQQIDKTITSEYVDHIIKTLSSDEMEGRATFSPGIEKAAAFIESEFGTIGLQPLKGENSFRQSFERDGKPLFNIAGMIPGKSKPEEYVVFSAQ